MSRARTALLATVLAALAIVGPGAALARAQATPTPSVPEFGDFNSVLGVGEGQNVNAAELGQYEATNQAPASFTNQEAMYSSIERASFSFSQSDFATYYKNSDFGSLPGGLASSESPETGLTILRDKSFQIPRIYGQTRPEVMFGIGYATAEDRLFFMDVLRHTAEGSMTDLLGPSAAPGDSAELGQQDFSPTEYTQQIDSLPQTAGAAGAQALQDIDNYIAGINAFIDQAKINPDLMPSEYAALGVQPQAWTEADTAAVAVYLIAQFTVSGGGQANDAQILRLLEQDHPTEAAAMYDDFRRLDDPETPLVADRDFPVDDPGPANPAAVALVDPGSVKARNAIVSGGGSAAARDASARSLPTWAAKLASLPRLGLPPRDSNAVLVEGSHSTDGHPLASMGPQVGYYSPEIFLEFEAHGGGVDVSGVGFPGAAPYALIGHGIDFAWTGTTANGGNEDVFAEKLCNPDGSTPSFASTDYQYNGQCIPFTMRTQTDTPPPEAPTSPTAPQQPVTLEAMRSVHGPVESYATVGGIPVALTVANATDFHAAQSSVAFMDLNENAVNSANSFISAMQNFTGNENWFYVDDHDIAWFQSGWFPLHAKGSSRDFPIWGTGQWDWQGFNPSGYTYDRLPDADLPQEIDPPAGYLVSWNNKEVPNWPAPAGTWSLGPAERVQALSLPLKSLLASNSKINLAQLTQVTTQAATKDSPAQALLPLLLQVLGPDASQPAVAPYVAALRQWQSDGTLRIDLGAGNVDEDSPAILLFDAWLPKLEQAMFGPALGQTDFNAISSLVNNFNERPNVSGFYDGWQGYVDKDLRDLLAGQDTTGAAPGTAVPGPSAQGQPEAIAARAGVARAHRRVRARHAVKLRHRRRHRTRVRFPGVQQPFSQVYCGGGSLSACQGLLVSTLEQAAASVAASQGTTDMSKWQVLAICPVPSTGAPTCDEEVPITAGAVTTPPFPFQNRGTFHQAVEVTSHR